MKKRNKNQKQRKNSEIKTRKNSELNINGNKTIKDVLPNRLSNLI